MTVSKSRKVNAYVKAKLAERALTERVHAQEAKLEPLMRRRRVASDRVMAAMAKMTGPQIREANIILGEKGAA